MHFSSYREFYHKALIPMGENDRTSLLPVDSSLTHWLIALEGQPRADDYYLWEVSIYPADVEGCFNWHSPLYKSSLYDSIDGAYKAAQVLEQFSKKDELSSINFNVKIS
jgi:hypothetical protein